MTIESYTDYLRSAHWAAFKRRYRASGLPQACFVCGSSKFELHHTTYARLGCERLEDVIPLCSAHHAQARDLIQRGMAGLKDAHIRVAERFRWIKRGLPPRRFRQLPDEVRFKGQKTRIENERAARRFSTAEIDKAVESMFSRLGDIAESAPADKHPA